MVIALLILIVIVLYIKCWVNPFVDITKDNTFLWYTNISGERKYIVLN